MGSATPPPQTPGLPGVCGAWVFHALRVCGGWVVLPLNHKLKNHVPTHAPQTPGLPGVCGGGVALPIHHKLKNKF